MFIPWPAPVLALPLGDKGQLQEEAIAFPLPSKSSCAAASCWPPPVVSPTTPIAQELQTNRKTVILCLRAATPVRCGWENQRDRGRCSTPVPAFPSWVWFAAWGHLAEPQPQAPSGENLQVSPAIPLFLEKLTDVVGLD